MDSKYGCLWGEWCSDVFQENVGEVSNYIVFEMGDGSRSRSRHDLWCGERVLKETFPEVYSVVLFKEASIVDNMETSSDSSVEYKLHQSSSRLGD